MEIRRIEWGVQYEITVQPRMDGTTEAIGTQVIWEGEERARWAASKGIPLAGRNHRVVRRYVTEWEEAPARYEDANGATND